MNTYDPQLNPLSIDELNTLQNFLISERTPAECLSSIEMLEAYMTALIVGPDRIDPDIMDTSHLEPE